METHKSTKLTNIIRSYLNADVRNRNLSEENRERIFEALYKEIEHEIIECSAEKYVESKQYWLMAFRLKAAKEFILLTVLVGFLIGIIVNQVTELLHTVVVPPWAIIICSLIGLFMIYKQYVIDKIEKYFKKKTT